MRLVGEITGQGICKVQAFERSGRPGRRRMHQTGNPGGIFTAEQSRGDKDEHIRV